MKANNDNLEDAVAHWHADAKPPSSLRARVLTVADTAQAPPPTQPRMTRHRVWWATGTAVALSAASFSVFITFSTTARPAYADVEQAMKRVKTVQWDSELTYDKPAAGKKILFTVHTAVQLNPPAIYARYEDAEHNSGSIDIETPYVITTRQLHKDKTSGNWRQGVEDKRARIASNLDPVIELRQRTEQALTWLTRLDNPKTTLTTVVENGRTLLRFDSQWVRESRKPSKHLRVVRSVWADPKTRRIVHTRCDSYTVIQHTVQIDKNFRYDEPLPEALFEVSRLQGALAR